MSGDRRLDLLREVLDHEVVDSEGIGCGMVDDLEFRVTEQGLVVTALLVGPGAWVPRLPALFAVMAGKVFGRQRVRVPWHHVVKVGEVIRLDATAPSLGLGVLDRKAGRWLARLPGS